MPASRKVNSNQTSLHKNLKSVVSKHLQSEFLKPVAEHNALAYAEAMQAYQGQPLIFDSGCGTGRSSVLLAKQYPQAFIIGIDKSENRLNRTTSDLQSESLSKPRNLFLIRADHDDFLRLALRDGVRLWKHKLFYPNPWPKSKHLKRRWHGSPLFKTLINLGGEIDLRSNWKLYLEEFSAALTLSGHANQITMLTFDEHEQNADAENTYQFVSDFEEKYHRSQQSLWRLCCQL